jgi:hypothetical protein
MRRSNLVIEVSLSHKERPPITATLNNSLRFCMVVPLDAA